MKDQCNERHSVCVIKCVAAERNYQIFTLGRLRDTESKELTARKGSEMGSASSAYRMIYLEVDGRIQKVNAQTYNVGFFFQKESMHF